MERLGYRSRAGFWSAVHQLGIPHIKITRRHCVFPEAELEAWIERRKVGGAV